MGIHARSRHRELNTLTCMVIGLQGWKTTIELHNDAYVSGLIVEADAKMNVEMCDAVYTDGNGKSVRLDNFHIMGRKIRFVHIPDQIDMMELIRQQVTLKPREHKMTKKGHIVMKRTEQTLKRYRREQEVASASHEQEKASASHEHKETQD